MLEKSEQQQGEDEEWSGRQGCELMFRQPGEREEREEALAAGGIDLLIVPGLAFTRQLKSFECVCA